MRRKDKLHLVRDDGKAPEPVSGLSDDEQAHLMNLADIAFHTHKDGAPMTHAGDRAQKDHKKLQQELREAVERIRAERKQRTG